MSLPDYFVESWLTSDHDDDYEITVRRNGKVIYLRWSPLQFHASPQTTAHYHKCLRVLQSGEQVIDDLYEDEAQDWLVKPFVPMITELAPEPPGGLGTPTLEKYFFADYIILTIDVRRDEFRPRRVETTTPPYIPWVWATYEFTLELHTWTEWIPPSQVETCYERAQDVLIKMPRRVRVSGHKNTYFFKRFCVGGAREEFTMKLDAFRKMKMADLDPNARVCRVHGVVGDGEKMLGMLLTLVDERMLLNWAKASLSPVMKKKWAAQIKQSLTKLHNSGLVWSDVKPHNVLIDVEDNAWLVDFGGSYTEGWVDKDKAGTVEGDLHGLAKILEFLSSDRVS